MSDKCKPKRCINHVVPISKDRTLVSGDRLTTAFRMSVRLTSDLRVSRWLHKNRPGYFCKSEAVLYGVNEP